MFVLQMSSPPSMQTPPSVFGATGPGIRRMELAPAVLAAQTPRDALLARIRTAQAEADRYRGAGNSFMRFIERIGGQEQDLNDLHIAAESNLQRLQRELAALGN